MRIGIITNHYLDRVGGAEEALDRLATHWHGLGHDVVLFSIRSRKHRRRREWKPAYAHVRLPYLLSTELGLGRYVRAMQRAHAEADFDVVLACDTYWAGHVALRFRQRTGVPFAVWSQGGDVMDTSRFLRKPRARARMAEASAEADAVFYISRYIRSCLEALAKPTGLVLPLPNGWPDEWAGSAPTAAVLAGRYVYAMGRLVPLKGFSTLVEAFARLRERHPGVRLVIGGEGPQLPDLLEQAAGVGLSVSRSLEEAGELILPGFVQGETKLSLIEHAVVGVSPSVRNEPMSLALFEMLSRGLPVVASRVGGTPDIIEKGVNGLLFEAGDAEALAGALDLVLSDDPLRLRLAESAAGTVAEHRWSRIANRALAALSEIAPAR